MNSKQLNNPILIAGWPGMGRVALTACYYLIAKLEMEFQAELLSSELYDVDHVTIESGLVQPFRYPKNQIFSWRCPNGGSDLLLFIGEAQPPHGRDDFCRKLIDFAQREGVTNIITFAAMATDSELANASRVVGVATDPEILHGLLEKDIEVLRNGSISGMNGILLGVAAERKMSGCCLLGELPAMFANIPYPKASIAVLKAMIQLTGIEVELAELTLDSERVEAMLSTALSEAQRLEQQQHDGEAMDDEEGYLPDPLDNERLSADEKELLEQLFEKAKSDRSKAFELKRELDRLNVFREYEDRFLDLFKKDDGV